MITQDEIITALNTEDTGNILNKGLYGSKLNKDLPEDPDFELTGIYIEKPITSYTTLTTTVAGDAYVVQETVSFNIRYVVADDDNNALRVREVLRGLISPKYFIEFPDERSLTVTKDIYGSSYAFDHNYSMSNTTVKGT